MESAPDLGGEGAAFTFIRINWTGRDKNHLLRLKLPVFDSFEEWEENGDERMALVQLLWDLFYF